MSSDTKYEPLLTDTLEALKAKASRQNRASETPWHVLLTEHYGWALGDIAVACAKIEAEWPYNGRPPIIRLVAACMAGSWPKPPTADEQAAVLQLLRDAIRLRQKELEPGAGRPNRRR